MTSIKFARISSSGSRNSAAGANRNKISLAIHRPAITTRPDRIDAENSLPIKKIRVNGQKKKIIIIISDTTRTAGSPWTTSCGNHWNQRTRLFSLCTEFLTVLLNSFTIFFLRAIVPNISRSVPTCRPFFFPLSVRGGNVFHTNVTVLFSRKRFVNFYEIVDLSQLTIAFSYKTNHERIYNNTFHTVKNH